MQKSSLMTVLAAGLLATAAHAQQGMLSVRTMALQAGDMPEVHLMGENGHLPVEFSAVQPGETMRALAANPLPLYHNRKDDAGNDAWVISQRVDIPTGAREILLLGWPSGDTTRYIAIKDNFSDARFNDWLLINASTRPVAFAAGDNATPIVIRPGSSSSHRFTLRADEGVAVRALTPVNDEPTVFFNTYWPVQNDRRTVVVFADDGERILVRRIADRLAAAP